MSPVGYIPLCWGMEAMVVPGSQVDDTMVQIIVRVHFDGLFKVTISDIGQCVDGVQGCWPVAAVVGVLTNAVTHQPGGGAKEALQGVSDPLDLFHNARCNLAKVEDFAI